MRTRCWFWVMGHLRDDDPAPLSVRRVTARRPLDRAWLGSADVSSLDRLAPVQGPPLSRSARLVTRALDRRWKLPPATAQVRVVRDVAVPMRDDAALRADV